METKILNDIIQLISRGGNEAIIAILLVVIAFFIYERRSLIAGYKNGVDELIKSKDSEKQTLIDINNKYHDSIMISVSALHEVKVVLETLKERKG